MSNATPLLIAVLVAELVPAVAFGCAAERVAQAVARWPLAVRVALPAVLVGPYVVIAAAQHMFRWQWFVLYAALPVVMAWLLARAAAADPEQRGNWRDAVILLTLGLAVHVRWSYWRSDWKTGLRELLFFAPAVLLLGYALGFIHPHANLPSAGKAALSWVGIFVFVAIPEELFFRAWVQNLLERRVGRRAALLVASVLFGLSHFNKRSTHFNWRYVLLATIAGIFYGRAWREHRRVPASTITHTCVDWLWSWWF